MDLLWPNLDSGAAANNLHKILHVARRVLEPALTQKSVSRFLQLSGDLVMLNVEDVWIDVVEFCSMAERARETQDIAAFREALALYSGDLLPEDRYEDWTIRPREDLRYLQLSLLLELADLYRQRGDRDDAIDVLRHVIGIDPAHEQAHVAMMELLAGSGQRQAALRQYGLLRQALEQELGAEPDAYARNLYSEILSGRYVPEGPLVPNTRAAVEEEPATDLVGRDSVLERLREHVDALSEGRGSAVLLYGEAGVGKSALAAMMDREASQQGAISLWGAAYRDEQDLPYGALGRMLEGFALRVGTDILRTLAGEHAIELAHLAPAFTRLLDRSGRTRLVADVLDEERIMEAMAEFLGALSNHVPVVITIEDLHWADKESIRFLGYIAHMLPEMQVLFVCTCRPEGITVRTELERLLRMDTADRGVECIEVYPLNDAEIEALVSRLLGGQVAEDVLDLISDISQGNPYFAEETVWALRGRRRIEQVNGVWRIRKGIHVAWRREDVRQLGDAMGDFQLVRKLRIV